MLSKLDDVNFSKLRDDNFKDFIAENELADKSLVKFLEDVDIEEKTLESYQQYLKDTGKSTSAFTSFTQKAGTALKSFGASLLSIGVNWAIGKVIDLIATGIDKFGNASKHAAENAKALASEMNNSISSISSNSSTLSDLNDEYQKLSKGVNKLGENVGLSTEDYNRYKEIISQVSSIMPNMTTYFNAQGEKIAFARGELQDLNKEYEEYIKKQAQDYIAKGDGDGNTIQDILNSYNSNKEFTGFEKFWSKLKNFHGDINPGNFTTENIIDELEKFKDRDYIQNSIKKPNSYFNNILTSARIMFGIPQRYSQDDAIRRMIIDELGLNEKTQDDIVKMTETEYNALIQKINAQIQKYNAKIVSDMNQINTALIEVAYNNNYYWGEDPDKKNDIITFLSSINSDIWDELQKKTDTDMIGFVNNIITYMSENKDGFADAWNGLFSPELKDLPVKEYAQQIDAFLKTICEVLELKETDGVHILKFSLGFDNVDDINKRLQNAVRALADDHGMAIREIVNSDEYAELLEIVNNLTLDEAELCLKAITDAESVTDAINGIKEALESVSDIDDPITFSTVLTTYKDQIDDIQSSISTLRSALDSLNSGSLDDSTVIDLMQEFPELAPYIDLTADGFGNLAEGLKVLIEQRPESLIKDLESLKDNLATDEEREQVDLLIGALQRLSNIEAEVMSFEDSLDKFQSSVKSAADAYTTLLTGNYSSSELLDSIQAINKAATDMGEAIDWEAIAASDNPLKAIQDEIESVSNTYAESVLSGAGIEDSDFGKMLANIVQEAYKSEAALSSLNTQIDSLQSAYNDLTDIVDSYNKTGYITFDQLQTLLAMEPQYLACLIDENGQLSLNQEAMTALANQRLNDARAQVIEQTITELGELQFKKEKTAIEDVTMALEDSDYTITSYEERLLDFIPIAELTTEEFIKLSNAINGAVSNGVSDEDIDEVIKNAEKKLKLVGDMWNGTLKNMLGGSSSEKDTTKEFDWIEQAIENVEKEVKALDDVVNSAYSTFSQKNEALAKEISKVSEEIGLQQKAYEEYMRKADSIGLSDDYKHLIRDGAINIENITDEDLQKKISDYQQWYEKAVDVSEAISDLNEQMKDLHVKGYELQAEKLEDLLDSNTITEKQYLAEMKKLYKEYYENQVEYAQKAHEAKMALLEKEKSYLNSVANAASSLLDKEIGKVQDNAKAQEEPYKVQIKEAEKQKKIYQDQIKAENKKIDAYNKEIDLINDKKKPLQDELDALEDKVRKEELALNLQKAQYDLAKAQNQKTKLVNYMPDTIVI